MRRQSAPRLRLLQRHDSGSRRRQPRRKRPSAAGGKEMRRGGGLLGLLVSALGLVLVFPCLDLSDLDPWLLLSLVLVT